MVSLEGPGLSWGQVLQVAAESREETDQVGQRALAVRRLSLGQDGPEVTHEQRSPEAMASAKA